MDRKLKLSEMAAHYRCSAKTFAKYVKDWKVPYTPLGRAKLFNAAEVEAHLKSRGCPEVVEVSRTLRKVRRSIIKTNRFAEAVGI